MKYVILEGKTILELVEKVNTSIKDGWKPVGGVSTGDTYGNYVVNFYYIQAMVKE